MSRDGIAQAIINEGRRRGITERGIVIALAVALVESGLKNYANRNVPESLLVEHDAVGSDFDSLGPFQQRCPLWGPVTVLMNPTLSAGLFYDRLARTNYNDPNMPPGEIAANIQRPAVQYRYRYAERMDEAQALFDRLAGNIPMPRVDSENGWRPPGAGPDIRIWITVPGTDPPVHLELMKGWPAIVLGAFAADLNAYVEQMRDNDSAGFTPTNAVATSNHLNGTAFDFNWESHPFHQFNTFNAQQMRILTELFDFYENTVAWGGKDWGGNPQDEMHFQMGYNTWMNPRVQDFINRKIRADGFSTFRRIESKDEDLLMDATPYESLSPYKRAGDPSHTLAEYIRYTDGSVHALVVEFGAITLEDPACIELVQEAADRGVPRALRALEKIKQLRGHPQT